MYCSSYNLNILKSKTFNVENLKVKDFEIENLEIEDLEIKDLKVEYLETKKNKDYLGFTFLRRHLPIEYCKKRRSYSNEGQRMESSRGELSF